MTINNLVLPNDYNFPQGFFISNFGEYVASQEPSDWAREAQTIKHFTIVADAALPSGQGLQAADTNAVYETYSWNRAGEAVDWDVLTLMKLGPIGTVSGQPGSNIRGFGARVESEPNTTYFGTGYYAMLSPHLSPQTMRLVKYDDDNGTPIATAPLLTIAENDLIWCRLRAWGDRISGKFWHDGDPEPVEFQLEATDADPLPEGHMGALMSSTGNQTFGFVSACSGGGVAPGL